MLMKTQLSRPTSPPPMFSKGTSLHRQLFLVLRDEISRGLFGATGALPKEEALCERFGVSRITVRRALADLAALGLVERRHGLGTFVSQDFSLARELPNLSLIDELLKTAMTTEVKVIEVTQGEPPADVFTLLKLEQAGKAVHAVRLRSIRGMPVMLTEAWVPASFATQVSVAALRERALYEILMAQGVRFGRVVQEITAVVADPVRAGHLRTESGGPLLKLVRVMHDVDARPVLHLTAYLPPERSRILMEIPAESVNTLSAGQFVYDLQ